MTPLAPVNIILGAGAEFWQAIVEPLMEAVGTGFTIRVYVAVAVCGAHALLLVTVIVKVTVFPASAAAAVYVGVKVVAPAVIEPAPFSDQEIVPFDEVAPLTVAVALEQIVCVPPAVAVGNRFTIAFVVEFEEHPLASVTVKLYVPEAAIVAPNMEGF